MTSEAIDIALFPIPNCVTFPGRPFPLHVFEPRYRRMVEHCTETGMPMAICHTTGLVSPAKSGQSVDEAMNSNQATYKPCNVFSAGRCELLGMLPDGRSMIHVHLAHRYQAIEIRQTLPFSIWSCQLYEDMPLSNADREELPQLREKVTHRLLALTASDEDAHEILLSPEWQALDDRAFSLRLFSLVQLEADLQQHLLESRSPLERLDILLSVMNS